MNESSSECGSRPARLLITPPAAGDWNMAVDEHLLLAAADEGRACLRFYEWSPATLSLGYFQRLGEREGHATSRACPVVRRASGGGAIVHDRELTYSFAVPMADRWSAQAGELYAAFHETLIATLAELGVSARLEGAGEKGPVVSGLSTKKTPDPIRSPLPFLCFERRTPLDVVIDHGGTNIKIAGSAQRRVRGAILQHGSILLARSSAAAELPGIAELTGRAMSPAELRAAWLPSLAERLGIAFEPDDLSPAELAHADQIAATKFGHSDWLVRR